jgi:hypothetical protein
MSAIFGDGSISFVIFIITYFIKNFDLFGLNLLNLNTNLAKESFLLV